MKTKATLLALCLCACGNDPKPGIKPMASAADLEWEQAICDTLVFTSSSVLNIYICPVDPDRATFKIFVAGHTEFNREWILESSDNDSIADECAYQVGAHVLEYLNTYAPD